MSIATEEIPAVLADAPLMTITVGGKEYHVKRVRAGDNPTFRKTCSRFASRIMQALRAAGDSASSESFIGGELSVYCIDEGCEELWETLFSMDPSLPRAEMERTVTSEEKVMAGLEVLPHVLPFVVAVVNRMVEKMSPATS